MEHVNPSSSSSSSLSSFFFKLDINYRHLLKVIRVLGLFRQVYCSARLGTVTCDDAVQWRPGSAGMLLANTEMKVQLCNTESEMKVLYMLYIAKHFIVSFD